MSVTGLEDRALASIYSRLGHVAQWEGVADPVRVILRDRDEQFGETVSDNITIRVRKSEVVQPESGDDVTLEDERAYQIIGTPLLNRKREWECEAAPA